MLYATIKREIPLETPQFSNCEMIALAQYTRNLEALRIRAVVGLPTPDTGHRMSEFPIRPVGWVESPTVCSAAARDRQDDEALLEVRRQRGEPGGRLGSRFFFPRVA